MVDDLRRSAASDLDEMLDDAERAGKKRRRKSKGFLGMSAF